MNVHLFEVPWMEVMFGMTFALLGAFFHFGKKSRRDNIQMGPVTYFFTNYPYSTAQAVVSMLVTIIILVAQDQVNVFEIGGILMMLSIGYSLDSAINRFHTSDDLVTTQMGKSTYENTKR